YGFISGFISELTAAPPKGVAPPVEPTPAVPAGGPPIIPNCARAWAVVRQRATPSTPTASRNLLVRHSIGALLSLSPAHQSPAPITSFGAVLPLIGPADRAGSPFHPPSPSSQPAHSENPVFPD